MADNFDTLWLQKSLNTVALAQAQQALEALGAALPCMVTAVEGSLVTVQFQCTYPIDQNGQTVMVTPPAVTIPKAESQWARTPTQVGDVGITVAADTLLGGISGQGSGIPDLSKDYGNLSTLVFVPIATTFFPASPNVNKFWGNGPAGARVGDSANGFYADFDVASGTVKLYCGSTTITLSSSGVSIAAGGKTWTFGSAGFTDSNGIVEETHVHGGVQSGSSMTTTPEAG